MKKINILWAFCLITVVALSSFTLPSIIHSKEQETIITDYCDGWEDGYCEGWKDVKGMYANCPNTPNCPNPIYTCMEGYRCGYNRGFKAGMKAANN